MNKQIIKSNSAFVVLGQSPAWTTGEDTVSLFPLVQGCNFGVNIEHQKSKQIGKQSYVINNTVKAPEVTVELSYFLNPYLSNELMIGFNGFTNEYQPCLSLLKNRDQNIYLISDPLNNNDGFDRFQIDPSSVNFSGLQAFTFGNCFLNQYSTSFAINSVPIVNVGFSSSNLRFENITGNKLSIPAINSISGNNSGSGFLNLSGMYSSMIGDTIEYDPEARNEFNPPVAVSNASIFTLQALQVGGASLSPESLPILQSFDLSIDLNRTDLYGLGSDYVYNRKLEFPVNGSVSIAGLVSGISSGEFTSLMNSESGYSLEVAFCDENKSQTGFYKVENAKLDNINYSMAINNTLGFQASFSFEANETGGLFAKRSTHIPTWNTIGQAWQNIQLSWQSL
jgi:hypothetical protein